MQPADLWPARRADACDFLRRLIKKVPYKIHTILTDNGVQFTNTSSKKHKVPVAFDKLCAAHGIDHRLTKPYHPWTNGQVERMHRTLKEETVYTYFYETHAQLRKHLKAFLDAYNFAKRLKALQGRSPYEFICDRWQEQPALLHRKPDHLTTGLYTHFASPYNCSVRQQFRTERRQRGRSGAAIQLLRIHTRISPGSRFAHR